MGSEERFAILQHDAEEITEVLGALRREFSVVSGVLDKNRMFVENWKIRELLEKLEVRVAVLTSSVVEMRKQKVSDTAPGSDKSEPVSDTAPENDQSEVARTDTASGSGQFEDCIEPTETAETPVVPIEGEGAGAQRNPNVAFKNRYTFTILISQHQYDQLNRRLLDRATLPCNGIGGHVITNRGETVGVKIYFSTEDYKVVVVHRHYLKLSLFLSEI